MNLARAQLIETIRPTFHSINFTSGVPTPSNNLHPINKQPEDPADLARRQRQPSDRSGNTENPKQPRRSRPVLEPTRPEPSKNRRNGHFVVAGEKGYAVWASGFKVGEVEGDETRSKPEQGGHIGKSVPTDRPVKLFERGQ